MTNKYKRKQKWIIEQLGHNCMSCLSSENLEIDHIDWRTKTTDKRIFNMSWEDIKNELPLLQLLCKECHIEKTRQDTSEKLSRNKYAEHGTNSMYTSYKCRCNLCKVAHNNYQITYRQKVKEANV